MVSGCDSVDTKATLRITKTSELRCLPFPFWKFFKKLLTYLALLSKSIAVSQNFKY